jgi:hypothetical protein
VAPSAASQIEVKVSMTSLERTKEIACLVRTDDPESPTVRYTAKVSVVRAVEFQDDRLSLGTLPFGQSSGKLVNLKVTTPRGAKHRIASLQASGPLLAARIVDDQPPPSTVGDYSTWQYPVQVTFQPEPEAQSVPLFVLATVSIDGREHQAETELSWRPEREFVTHPSRVVLAVDPSVGGKSATIEVGRIDGQPFSLVVAKSSSPRLKIHPMSEGLCTSQSVQVEFLGEAQESDRIVSVVTIQTDSQIEPRFYVPVAVFATRNSTHARETVLP